MKTLRQTAAAALFALASLAAAAAPSGAAFEAAKMALERGHYAEAHRMFALLADCGHRESARIALEMRQFGPQLYGMVFTVGPKRLTRWRGVLANAETATAAGDSGCPLDTKPAQPMNEDREIWRHQGAG